MRDHKPKAGRLAFVCAHEAHQKDERGGMPRVFVNPDDPVPTCPQHGSMKLQENHPYRGMPIPVPA